MIWYFGYGSNMSPAIFMARRKMRPLATCRAWLAGYRLCFNIPVGPGERGVANLEPEADARTWGVLYLLTPTDCERLDRSEGVPAGIYARLAVSVNVGPDAPVDAFTYRSSLTMAGRKASPRYMGLLLDGARRHGLPAEYLRFLESFALARDEREEP